MASLKVERWEKRLAEQKVESSVELKGAPPAGMRAEPLAEPRAGLTADC